VTGGGYSRAQLQRILKLAEEKELVLGDTESTPEVDEDLATVRAIIEDTEEALGFATVPTPVQRFKEQKLRTYQERMLICLQILDTLGMTDDEHITAAHHEALAIWKEQS